MMTVPLRALYIGLVASCVLLVGVLCTALTLVAATRALHDTRASRDASVSRALESVEATMLKVSQHHLSQMGDGVVRQLDTIWAIPRDIVSSLCKRLTLADPAEVKTWPYLYGMRSELYNTLLRFRHVNAIGVITTKLQAVSFVDHADNIVHKEKSHRHVYSVINNGSDYSLPGENTAARTLQGDVYPNGTGTVYGYPEVTDPVVCPEREGDDHHDELKAPCKFVFERCGGEQLSLFNTTPAGTTYHSGLVSIDKYAVLLSQCDYVDSRGIRSGLVYVGSDVGLVTTLLASLDLKLGQLGRVYAAVRQGWDSPDRGQFGFLTGSSHGSVSPDTTYVEGRPQLRPMPAWNSSDPIIAGAALYLEQDSNDTAESVPMYEVLLSESGQKVRPTIPHAFMMPTDRSPEGERFFVWYVCCS
eukprot:TRINITY_DN15869_c0_g1_i2.p1 TRINITY_DN15869_c0_g1~~TRINITY_DN15869_c0_g1_i2.p1  ORF type:complete len:416 (+),score=134.16 TRINITY_DN15869_c0_g1_i2:108-1355(+)